MITTLSSPDRSSPIPLYVQVAGQVEQAITGGQLSPGDPLGNEIALAKQIGVSRLTVRKAIECLVSKGMLVRTRGVGTQVVQGQLTRPDRTSLFDDLTERHENPQTNVLAKQVVRATQELATTLLVPPGAPVLWLRRIRLTRGVPLAILDNYLRTDLIKLRDADFTSCSLYHTIRAAGIHIRLAKQSIGARIATSEEGWLLGEGTVSAVLTVQRVSHDGSGRPVEMGQHVFRASKYSVDVNLTQP